MKFVITLIVERDCDEELDTAVVSDILDMQLAGIDGVRPVAMKVSESANIRDNPAAHMLSNTFIVQNEEVFKVEWNQDSRKWNCEVR